MLGCSGMHIAQCNIFLIITKFSLYQLIYFIKTFLKKYQDAIIKKLIVYETFYIKYQNVE